MNAVARVLSQEEQVEAYNFNTLCMTCDFDKPDSECKPHEVSFKELVGMAFRGTSVMRTILDCHIFLRSGPHKTGHIDKFGYGNFGCVKVRHEEDEDSRNDD